MHADVLAARQRARRTTLRAACTFLAGGGQFQTEGSEAFVFSGLVTSSIAIGVGRLTDFWVQIDKTDKTDKSQDEHGTRRPVLDGQDGHSGHGARRTRRAVLHGGAEEARPANAHRPRLLHRQQRSAVQLVATKVVLGACVVTRAAAPDRRGIK